MNPVKESILNSRREFLTTTASGLGGVALDAGDLDLRTGITKI